MASESESKTKTKYQQRLESLARYIKSEKCNKIVLMANLARLNLPYPEAVFEIGFFNRNPEPFYTLAHELYPGKYRPTPTHSFIRLLADKGLLSMCLTQNIDTLERRAGVPANKIIEAHGSFAKQRCVLCRTPFDDAKMKDIVMNFSRDKRVPRCERKTCQALVKPDIVFFGEALPPEFMQAPGVVMDADLLIVIGTSLTVHPFASLASETLASCIRVLINLEEVGDFDEADDVLLLGKCDDVVKDLCRALGWEEELDRLWEDTANSLEVGSKEESEKHKEPEIRDAQQEVEDLAKKIQSSMDLNNQDGKDEEQLERKAEEPVEQEVEKVEKDVEPSKTNLPIQGAPLDVSAVSKESEEKKSSTEEKDVDGDNKEKL
ncbi:Sir2 histone deacetylase Hst2 [Marasmius crinis-equi]|uniref:Sir2 histone deacetylase Hst2 n=1 Tax=Marasmius crinis-equi TaxID=585013 RepID=A0ABR3FWQ7_9AGAR